VFSTQDAKRLPSSYFRKSGHLTWWSPIFQDAPKTILQRLNFWICPPYLETFLANFVSRGSFGGIFVEPEFNSCETV
jgi:hypothetical protein